MQVKFHWSSIFILDFIYLNIFCVCLTHFLLNLSLDDLYLPSCCIVNRFNFSKSLYYLDFVKYQNFILSRRIGNIFHPLLRLMIHHNSYLHRIPPLMILMMMVINMNHRVAK